MKKITSNSDRFNKLLLIIEQHHKAEALKLLNKIAKDWAPFNDIKGELGTQFRLNNRKAIKFIEKKAKEHFIKFNYLLKSESLYIVEELPTPVYSGAQFKDPDGRVWTVQFQNEPPFETF